MEGESKATRLITRVVVYYRQSEDGEEHQITLESTKGGGPIDGVAWNTPLIRKIVYRENGKYVDPQKGKDPGDWKLSSSEGEALSLSDSFGECFWVHMPSCSWAECCPDQ